VSEIVAIWLGGAAVLVLVGVTAGVFLRFTRVGREQELSLRDTLTVIAVCVGFGCALYTLVALVL
jgi:hypothetical protein